MNNKEFISALSLRTSYTQADTQRLVNSIINAMADSFIEGNNISVANFGTFEIKKKNERVMVNPTTQKRMLVPPKLVLTFKPISSWKEKLKKQQPAKDGRQ